jgi:hypothetical protein
VPPFASICDLGAKVNTKQPDAAQRYDKQFYFEHSQEWPAACSQRSCALANAQKF